MPSLRLSLHLCCLIVALYGCDRKKAAPSEPTHPTGSLQLRVIVPSGAGPTAAAKVTVTSGRLIIAGEGMSTIDTLLAVQNGFVEGTIRGIPVGQRSVEVILLDAGGNRLWDAITTVTIVKDETAEAVLRLSRVGDAPPQITSIGVTPAAAPVDSTFRFAIVIEDIHDPTDSLEVRWDFDGDGSFDADWTFDRSWTFTYQSEGSFTAVAQVRDRADSISTASQPVEVFRLVAITGGSAAKDTVSASLADDRVSIDGSQSTATSGREVIYHWAQVLDIPEAINVSVLGTLSDNDSPSASRVNFSSETGGRGLYVFTLLIEDKETGALSAPDTLYVLVSSAIPVASVVDPPTTVEVGRIVVLRGQATDADGDELQYRWRGDRVDLLSDTTSIAPAFAPDGGGEFSFFFVAIDEDLQESEPLEVVITVPQPDPVAAFIASPTSGKTPLEVTFINNSQYGETYLWSFGTGDTSEEEVPPSYSYDDVGSYEVVLRVFSIEGQVDSSSQVISVTDLDRPDLQVERVRMESDTGAEVTAINEGEEVAFRITLFNGGTLASAGFGLQVFLDNGTDPLLSLENLSLDPQTRTPRTTTLWRATAGDHVLRVSVTPSVSGVEEVNVENDALELSFSVNAIPTADAGKDVDLAAGLVARLDGGGSSDADGDSLTYIWQQIEGSAGILEDAGSAAPAFIPPAAGTYTLSLVVSDGKVVSEADEVEIRVTRINSIPVADAGPDLTVDVGATVVLGGTSVDADGDSLTYTWQQTGGRQPAFRIRPLSAPRLLPLSPDPTSFHYS